MVHLNLVLKGSGISAGGWIFNRGVNALPSQMHPDLIFSSFVYILFQVKQGGEGEDTTLTRTDSRSSTHDYMRVCTFTRVSDYIVIRRSWVRIQEFS